jgi:predicted deacetylase
MECLLDKYTIKPIVGVIPRNSDPYLVKRWEENRAFWDLVKRWQHKGWTIAMHGYTHVRAG